MAQVNVVPEHLEKKSFGNPHELSCRVVFTLQNPKSEASSV